MSEETLIRFFQGLLTTVDPSNDLSVASSHAILANLVGLLRSSGPRDSTVVKMAVTFRDSFSYYCRHREDYARRSGDHDQNRANRSRLRQSLTSG